MAFTALADELWSSIRTEAQAASEEEPALASFYHATILNHDSFASAMSFHLANKLDSQAVPAMMIREVFELAMARDADIEAAMRADIYAHCERDPACEKFSTPFLFFKGFHALQAHRFAHHLWQRGRRALALYLQNQISEAFGVDIHPGARIGRGIMIDHATGVVIGETAVIGDDVSMLHSVTLGGAGRSSGDRHPKVGRGVLISTGAKLLGNIQIGDCAKIGAGSVVLDSVPAHTTVAGVPATVVGHPKGEVPARDMDQGFNGSE
ncbi:serine O-acetyltransferase [Marinimicrobium agarilyticum]|uniref:serine O-acetyltransferase n=1 Tax=Marinimicrobium agarilyticum TaxID=306546 RepID=UPI0003F7FC0F|nr:serine O-acetyltransferase [Marinimicrobium agarilyticum]